MTRGSKMSVETKPLRLSGSQPFTQQPGVFILIGERTNVAGDHVADSVATSS